MDQGAQHSSGERAGGAGEGRNEGQEQWGQSRNEAKISRHNWELYYFKNTFT